jgi:hypothetical protein
MICITSKGNGAPLPLLYLAVKDQIMGKLSFQVVIFTVATLVVLAESSIVFAAPTALTKTQDLAFGTFVGGGGFSGTVTIDTLGARSSSGNVVLVRGTYNAARFTLTGNAGRTYTLTLPATYTITSGTYSMTVTSVTASIPTTGTIPSSGTLNFTVGATVSVGVSQQIGIYNGNFTVSLR